MLPDGVKEGVETLPLIEKVATMQSTQMIFVVILTVDLCLLYFTQKNIITYDWTVVHANLHYGKLAICFALSLLGYVVAVPVVSDFFLKIFLFLEIELVRPVGRWLLSLADQDNFAKIDGDENMIPTRQLRVWAIEHQDQFALELVREKVSKLDRDRRRQASLHHSSAALIILFALEYATSGGLWTETSGFIHKQFSGDVQIGFMLALIFSIVLPLLSWWWTRDTMWHDGLVFYPKAAKERYDRLHKKPLR